MQLGKIANGANSDGTVNDQTVYVPESWNDNIGNLFTLVKNAGYTLIDDDGTPNSLGLQQMVKATKGQYNAAFTYNTNAIPEQTVSDVVRGSDGKYYEAQNDGFSGDDPVGSVSGNWLEVAFDLGATGEELPSITGTATFTNSTQNINLVGVGALTDLTIGDVVQVTDSTSNNTEYTVEFITDSDNIVVNYEHRGQLQTTPDFAEKALIDEVSTSGVTIKILSKWYNAPIDLGRGWCTPTSGRAENVTYANSGNRGYEVALSFRTQIATEIKFFINNNRIGYINQSSSVASVGDNISAIVTKGSDYILEEVTSIVRDLEFKELR